MEKGLGDHWRMGVDSFCAICAMRAAESVSTLVEHRESLTCSFLRSLAASPWIRNRPTTEVLQLGHASFISGFTIPLGSSLYGDNTAQHCGEKKQAKNEKCLFPYGGSFCINSSLPVPFKINMFDAHGLMQPFLFEPTLFIVFGELRKMATSMHVFLEGF